MQHVPAVVTSLGRRLDDYVIDREHRLFERFASVRRAAAAEVGAITILVSHRFSTARMADTIVVVDGGRVVEAGSHDELVARGGFGRCGAFGCESAIEPDSRRKAVRRRRLR